MIFFSVSAAPKDDTPSGNKRVSWGPYISPEYIDKNMPPATPVRRGATPTTSESSVKATPQSLLKKSLLPKRAIVRSFFYYFYLSLLKFCYFIFHTLILAIVLNARFLKERCNFNE